MGGYLGYRGLPCPDLGPCQRCCCFTGHARLWSTEELVFLLAIPDCVPLKTCRYCMPGYKSPRQPFPDNKPCFAPMRGRRPLDSRPFSIYWMSFQLVNACSYPTIYRCPFPSLAGNLGVTTTQLGPQLEGFLDPQTPTFGSSWLSSRFC